MPIYEFQCPKCGKRVEELLARTSGGTPTVWCKPCETQMEYLLPTCSAHFKGEGWARDGYANKAKKQ